MAKAKYDVVGSYLRPAAIKEARLQFKAGKISADALKKVEDSEIGKLVEHQKAAGLPFLTDGEFRRSYWHLDFMWGFNGVKEIELDHGYYFHNEETTHGSIEVTGKINGEKHPFLEHFKFVQQYGDGTFAAKQTIPAPAQLLAELFREDNGKKTIQIYPKIENLIQDIAAAYRTVIRELYDAGCRNIQFDDCTWGMFCDSKYWESRQKEKVSFEEEAEKYLRVNNLALEGKPKDLRLTTHVCRGNYHSTYACTGAYDPIAPYLFAKENVDAFYLEYDDERSGGFAPLACVADGKDVVLGLITTKSAKLEDRAAVIARIHEASKYIPLERLSLSPQCGFASCEIGNTLTEEEQWAKIALVKEIAEEVWGL